VTCASPPAFRNIGRRDIQIVTHKPDGEINVVLKFYALIIFGSAFAATGTLAATVPSLSGAYAYSHSTLCQPTVLVNYGNGIPSLINLNGGGPNGGWGDVQFDAGVATFNKSTLTVSYTGTDVEGSPVMLQSVGGGPDNLQGTALAQSASSGKTAFANTATTVTLNGQSYNAVYGARTAGGVAEYVSLVGLDAKGCANLWTFYRQ
jgi:hypothetical protein